MRAIQPNELRIGNYVSFKTVDTSVGYETIDDIIISIMDLQNLSSASESVKEAYEPIPLNNEWLIRLGFEKLPPSTKYGSYHADHEANFGNPVLKINGYDYLNSNGSHLYIFLNKIRIECKYVHQLQNLYYALTQTELKQQP